MKPSVKGQIVPSTCPSSLEKVMFTERFSFLHSNITPQVTAKLASKVMLSSLYSERAVAPDLVANLLHGFGQTV